jgi:hypothetical protein
MGSSGTMHKELFLFAASGTFLLETKSARANLLGPDGGGCALE